MDDSVVCQEYSSSLEDLTFNSKPLINMLTMLAEENNQHAAEIVKLIEERIYKVNIEQKLPALYLMDSIVKNIGKDYNMAVTKCIVALFTHVFEKGDEKVRMSLYKLRNTWPPVFPTKKLHEIDLSVHKIDPGWPVVNPPPVSPSIHINPKFLSKVEEETSSSDNVDVHVLEDFQRKQKELENLQGEQMRLQMQEITEIQLKHDLIMKKQEQERQKLIKQQKEQILQMKLREENVTSDSTEKEVKGKGETTDNAQRSVKSDDVSANKTKQKSIPQRKDTLSEKKPEHVGFDTEFVPLDSDKSGDVDSTSDTAYNRDRPLGNKRYFKKKTAINKRDESKHKNRKSDHDRQPKEKSGPVEKTHDHKQRRNRHRDLDFNKKSIRGRQYRKHNKNTRYDDQAKKRTTDEDVNLDEVSMDLDDSDDVPVPLGNTFRGSRRGRPAGWDRRNRQEQGGIKNTERATDRSGRDKHSNETFEKGILGEPPCKKTRNSPPRPLFSEDEISQIRDRHRNSPPPGFAGPPVINPRPPPDWRPGRAGDFRPRWPTEQGHRMPLPEFHQQHDLPPRHPPHINLPSNNFAGGVEIPLELTLDNESSILQSAQHRLRTGDLSQEQYNELLEKLHQLYELQKWQRRRSLSELEGSRPPPAHHPDVNRPRSLDPRQGFPMENVAMEERDRRDFPLLQPPVTMVDNHRPGVPQTPQLIPPPQQLPPRQEHVHFEHSRLPPTQHIHRPPLEPTLHGHPPLSQINPKVPHPSEVHVARQNLPPGHEQLPLNPPQSHMPTQTPPSHLLPSQLPPSQLPSLQHPPSQPPPTQLQPLLPLPSSELPSSQKPPSQLPSSQLPLPLQQLVTSHVSQVEKVDENNQASDAPPGNLVMEKQAVDDLFKRLMNFGIITKIPQEAARPVRPLTPPVVEKVREIPIPEIKLKDIRNLGRFDGVIVRLYRGTQCSSCGLRFNQKDNEQYRQHLDWHFRVNRKEKETVAAHRNWFITEDDWLEFESSEDPKLKARSSVFEAEPSEEKQNSEEDVERSCPVLREDKEAESACDICLEKFEQFWDETSEDWHYKDAVRIDGKTYHYLCYQDVGQEGNTEEDSEAMTDEAKDVDNVVVKVEDGRDEQAEDCGVIKDISNDNVTQNTETGGQLGVDDTNKEEIKKECC